MRKRTRILPLVLLGAFLCACGVGIQGQRTTWRYDEERDTLEVLVHFDGIFLGDEEKAKGEKTIREFVRHGGLVVFPFVITSREDLEKTAADGSEPPAARAFAKAIAENLSISIVGHYHDGADRIGALQYLEIASASKVLAAANAALNESVLEEDPDDGWHRTRARMLPGAKAGGKWIFREGNAFGIEFPAHPAEWRKHRAEALAELLSGDEQSVDETSFLGLGPLSYRESRDGVRFRIGDPSRPEPMRLRTGFQGAGGVDEVVKDVASTDLDDFLADRLLGRVEEVPSPAIAALLAWGPPEDRARALIRRAEATKGEDRKVALGRLAQFAEEWNETIGLPEAPGPDADLAAWWSWYDEVLDGPYGD